MLYHSHNPFNVLSETISLDNVQQMGELIALTTLRAYLAYSHQPLERLYFGLVKDLFHRNQPHHVFSDGYDLAQNAICFLCEFIGKKLNDVYAVHNGKAITIKKAAHLLIGRQIYRIRNRACRFCHLDSLVASNLSIDTYEYQEEDYVAIDNTIEKLNLDDKERIVLDCYMSGMTCEEIAQRLGLHRVTVWRKRTSVQAKYKTLFQDF